MILLSHGLALVLMKCKLPSSNEQEGQTKHPLGGRLKKENGGAPVVSQEPKGRARGGRPTDS